MGRSPIFLAVLGYAYGRAGRTGEARKILAEFDGIAQKAHVPSLSFAEVFSGLGDIDKCLDWLERAVEEGDSLACLVAFNPIFAPIRSHPRYQTLLRKMNLEA
jgi:hypothetical protein